MAERSEWQVGRTEAVADGGMVAAKTPQAADVGADVLKRGGNAVDAAVATAFAAWVVEPWMNGIGGGGYMVVHDPAKRETVTIEFPMVAPAGATEQMFPLAGGGRDAALFGWPTVVDNANIVGHRSVAVPGAIAGLARALETYGTISLAEAMAPAIAYAENGFPVTWHTTLRITQDLATLAKFPASRAIFCDPAGYPWLTLDETTPTMLRQTDLAATLRIVADQGPRAFYEGELADQMVAHLNEGGASFTPADFSSYEVSVVPALKAAYHGHEIATIGKATGGTTLAQSMRLLDGFDLAAIGHNTPETLHLLAESFHIAFADRFAYLADPTFVDVPLAAMLGDDYLDRRRAGISRDQAGPIRAGSLQDLGVTHQLAGSMADYSSGGSTTHLSAIDANGMAVSLTQTLLSLWGSRVTVPGTGILMNNGMMWFDPEPGRPNSVAGGKRPLSNMSPALLLKDGQALAALGASGGRKIMNCVAQIAMNLADHGLSMQPATSAPRIDASTPALYVNADIDPATTERLRAMGHRIVVKDDRQLRGEFSSPACVQAHADGTFRGGVDPWYFPATASGATIASSNRP
ncbi:MAG: gamma-glutamyltransferase [Thermomicrobiales bacterium]|nr:gamma-glutamyltransferase [Thermomicrobiales bacterium]